MMRAAYVLQYCSRLQPAAQAMLSIGAALLGAGHVLGVDCDADALNVALDNCEEFEGLPVRHDPTHQHQMHALESH